MIKRIVVAATFSQFATYCRNRKFKREETGYYVGGHPEKCAGLNKETTQVHFLEGWQNNKDIQYSDVDYLNKTYTIKKDIPERVIHSEGFIF